VLVVAATNRPDLVDPALLRPGRFDSLIHVGLPDGPGRRQVLDIHTRKMPLHADVDLQAIADRTDRYSGAELAALAREAALTALEEEEEAAAVAQRHFEKALQHVTPRTTQQTLDFFATYEASVNGGAKAAAAVGSAATGVEGNAAAAGGFTFKPEGEIAFNFSAVQPNNGPPTEAH
jgi:transitional endoplasmic reticulum ATPase